MVEKDIIIGVKDKKARIALWSLFLLLGIISIMFMYFVFAAHVVTTSGGAIIYNVNEDVGFIYNITVNNTDAGDIANITQVNISFAVVTGFLFVPGASNGTDALGDFTNTSNVLSWSNFTNYLINGSQWKNFWFNATVATPGSYNVTIISINSTSVLRTNITLVVNDTTDPSSIEYGTNTETDGSNITRNNIVVNVTANDNGAISSIIIRLFNSTRNQINSSLNTTSPFSPFLVNFTGLADGVYYFNATINDTFGLQNSTATRTLRIDRTAPTINFGSLTPVNNSILTSSLTINISSSDSGVGIGTMLIRLYNSTRAQINSSSSSSSPLNVTFTGLSGTYYINATVNDTLGNTNSTETRTYILTATSFEYNGTTKDENGNRLNNTAVNITIRNQQWGIVGYVSTTANASGGFNFSVPLNAQWFYESSMTHFNGSFVDFKSKSLPAFPFMMMQMLGGTIYYLSPAGTINITAVNSTGARITFQYQVKDTALGYAIASDFNSQSSETIVSVPRNRNYSIMIYPNQNMPVSYNWNNFTSTTSYNFNYSSNYNHTTYILTKQFNVTTSLPRVSGYINYSGISGWNEFTVVPYLVEPGNMISATWGALPYNLSSGVGSTDNISVPATAETSTILLFASARNGSQYIGGFRNISLAYGTTGETTGFNFTAMSGLFGNPANISMNRIDGQGAINITTAKQTFSLINASNASIGNTSAHIEVTVDYSSLQAFEFTWMADIDQSASVSNFVLPLLNSSGIKEMNIFASGGGGGDNGQYAPKRVSLTVSQIPTNNNITIRNFNPGDIDGAIGAGQITIGLYFSNSSCDVPVPAASCILGDSGQETAESDFNPMQAVMGGGKISFRMGVGNITVHYVNVDMLASGPPDALFDSATQNSTSGNSFDAAVRFGSAGPTIYDYVLVSIPYSETAGVGLNDSAQVNASIPVYYDDNWNVIWNTTANGTNQGAFVANNSHYSGRQSEWGYLLNRTACGTSVNGLNATNPCYIDTANNKIWIRLPHFSGTGPSITGSAVPAAATTTTSTTTTGSTAASSVAWISTYVDDKKEMSELKEVSRWFGSKERSRILVSGEKHYVGVVGLTTTSATINVSSVSQQAVFNVGDEKKFDVTEDEYYDLSIKLNKILSNRANISISYIHEKIGGEVAEPTPTPTATPTPTPTATPTPAGTSTGKKIIWIVLIIIVLAIIIWVIYFLLIKKGKGKARRRY